MPMSDPSESLPSELRPPGISFQGRHWSSDELADLAARWGDVLRDDGDSLVAVVMANHPHAVAALFAASSGSRPVIVLPRATAAWRTDPPVPPGTRLILPPVLAELASAGEPLGLRATVLSDATASSAQCGESAVFVNTPGFVLFTSGSTGAPKPVYRTVPQVLGSVTRILDAVAAPRAAAIAGTLPLSTTHGVSTVLAAAVRGGTLALLDRFEPAAVLTLFASRQFDYWPAVPVMAEMLTRLAARRPVQQWRVPERCTVAGAPLAEPSWHAFREQFGVPLRAIYGSTEVGMVSIDAAPADQVRPGRAGQVAKGVQVVIGEDPRAPAPAGVAGRIWLKSPLYMEGYGYPPRLERPEAVDGWRAMPDLGRLSEDGQLSIVGRTDEAFKTQGGYLIEPGAITAALSACPGVTDAVVVPVPTPSGVVAGALVESSIGLAASELRTRLATTLPLWSRPRLLHVVSSLPRLATGKIDRVRCAAILRDMSASPSR